MNVCMVGVIDILSSLYKAICVHKNFKFIEAFSMSSCLMLVCFVLDLCFVIIYKMIFVGFFGLLTHCLFQSLLCIMISTF